MLLTAILLATAQAAAPTPAPAATATPAPAPASRLNLDTPIQDIVADPKGRAVLDADLPALRSNEMYDSFKTMSLRQLQPYAGDKLPDPLLAKVGTDLAMVK